MIQAARSGKQNIAEGSAAGVISMETVIKLTNVAKASFLELRLDYEDFLRVRNSGNGKRIPKKSGSCGKSRKIQPSRTNGSSNWPKAVPPKQSPIWRSYSCIRKIIFSRPN